MWLLLLVTVVCNWLFLLWMVIAVTGDCGCGWLLLLLFTVCTLLLVVIKFKQEVNLYKQEINFNKTFPIFFKVKSNFIT